MKPSHVREVLTRTIPAGMPVMLVGAPGVGKTSIVNQSAAECGYDVVTTYAALKDPTDSGGIPWPDASSNSVRYLPSPEIVALCESKRPCVWHLDDFGQAPSAVQASYMQWLLAREVHGMRLPDHVTILISTNRRQDRAGVTGILEPVKSRFASILHVEPDLDDLRAWWLDEGLPIMPLAFASSRWSLLTDGDTASAEIVNRPNPRTLEHFARLEELGLPGSVRREALSGACGEGFAIEYLAFCQMNENAMSIDQILLDPTGAKLPANPAQLYATAIGLSARADVLNFDRVEMYLQRLHDAGNGDFCMLVLRDSTRRTPAITTTKGAQHAMLTWASSLVYGDKS